MGFLYDLIRKMKEPQTKEQIDQNLTPEVELQMEPTEQVSSPTIKDNQITNM